MKKTLLLTTFIIVAFGVVFAQADTGDDCLTPITVTLPLDSPYADNGQTTSGRGNDYDVDDSLTCLEGCDNSEEIVYEITVTQEIWLSAFLTPEFGFYSSGIALDDDCPPDADCIAVSILWQQPHGFNSVHLLPGVYYIMAGSWNDGCFNFDLSLTADTTAPVGRCCDYTSGPLTPVCTDGVTEQNCQGELKVWDEGLDCNTPCWTPAGETCEMPISVTVPADLPYLDSAQTTCGRVNDYFSGTTCLGTCVAGEDIIYEITVTEETWISASLSKGFGMFSTGMALDDDCPPNDECIAVSTAFGGGTHGFEGAHLWPGVYYIMIDMDGAGCFDFDLRLTEVESIGRCCDYTSGPTTPVCTDSVFEENCQGEFMVWAEGLNCVDDPCPLPDTGDICWLPITVTLPLELPYADSNQTTLGRGNYYDDPDDMTCLGDCDDSEEIVYEITVTEEIWLTSWIDREFGWYTTGIAVDDNCPPDGECLAVSIEFGNDHGFEVAHLLPGVYYIMIGNGGPGSFNFHLTLDGTTTAPIGRCCYGDLGDPDCVDTTEEACIDLSGVWDYGLNCFSDPCPVYPPGRCCYFDEDPPDLANPICVAPVIEDTCFSLMGEFFGIWSEGITDCNTDPCPVPTDFTGTETFDFLFTSFTHYSNDGSPDDWQWDNTRGNPPGCALHWANWSIYEDDYLISNGTYTVPDVDNISLVFDQQDPTDPGWCPYVLHEVLISTDFAGDPATANWTQIYEGDVVDEWKTRGVSLEAYRNQGVNIAFHYAGMDADAWWVDNVFVEPWVPPTGRCCYGDDLRNPLCADGLTEDECYAEPYFGYDWVEAGDCERNICLPILSECPINSIFSQKANVPEEEWWLYASELDIGDGTGFMIYEDFSGIEEDICDIHFWGAPSYSTNGCWLACDENPMDFLIAFYPDAEGIPDTANPACVYNLTITGTPLPDSYDDFIVYEYSATFDTCCTIEGGNGWVSIIGTSGPDCWFRWLTHDTEFGMALQQQLDGSNELLDVYADLAFCLTPGGSACFEYLPGDANMVAGAWPPQIIGSDVTHLVAYFRQAIIPCFIEGAFMSGDANGDCLIIGSDVTRLVAYFRGAAVIEWCGNDEFDPESYPPCWPTPDDVQGVPMPGGWPNCDIPVTSSK